MGELKRPKESFSFWWDRKRKEEFMKDMANIYACGYFVLSRKNIPIKEKDKLQNKIESIIDKRICYYRRRVKTANGWLSCPANWDERNKSAIRSLYKKYSRHK